jgi:xylulokinase
VDVGTTGCKAALFSADGECRRTAYREYAVMRPQAGWAELDSRGIWESIQAVIAEVVHAEKGDPVKAVGISSLGEAMTPVDRERRILGNSILMSDARGAQYAEAMQASLDAEKWYAINPNIPGPHYSMPKLCWIRDQDPDLFKRTWKFLHWGNLVAYLLGGEARSTYSLANRTLLFDLHGGCWSKLLLEKAGISEDKLPAVVPDGTVVGRIRKPLAESLGLPADAQIVTGTHDQCCNALGAGIVAAGRAVCGIGTFECNTPVYSRLPDNAFMRSRGLNIEHHCLPGLYVSFLYNQAGSLVSWFRDTFAAAEKAAQAQGQNVYDRLTAEMPKEPTSLFVLPYFEMTGPPNFSAGNRGAILGLSTSTTRGEILKGFMESITFYFAESLRDLTTIGIDTTEFIATGGGARSDAWLQMKADILGVPFRRLTVPEVTAAGAAMLAGLASGTFSSPAEAARIFVRPGRIFEPNEAQHRRYQEKLAAYRRMVSAVIG